MKINANLLVKNCVSVVLKSQGHLRRSMPEVHLLQRDLHLYCSEMLIDAICHFSLYFSPALLAIYFFNIVSICTNYASVLHRQPLISFIFVLNDIQPQNLVIMFRPPLMSFVLDEWHSQFELLKFSKRSKEILLFFFILLYNCTSTNC